MIRGREAHIPPLDLFLEVGRTSDHIGSYLHQVFPIDPQSERYTQILARQQLQEKSF